MCFLLGMWALKMLCLKKKCYSMIFVWSKLPPPPLPFFFFTIRTAPALWTSRQYDNENVSPNDLSFLKLKSAPSLRGGGHHDISIQANFVHMNLWIHTNSMWYVLEFPILSEIVSWSFFIIIIFLKPKTWRTFIHSKTDTLQATKITRKEVTFHWKGSGHCIPNKIVPELWNIYKILSFIWKGICRTSICYQ